MTENISQRIAQAADPANSVARARKNSQNLPLLTQQADKVSSNSVTTNFDTAESLSDIAKKYDVRNMSPREISQMSQELYQSGSISFQDHALLSFQPELGSDFTGAI